MTSSWNNTYSVGIPAIDAQHKQFVAIFNDLLKTNEQTNPEAPVGELLARLLHYASEHFATEEMYFSDLTRQEADAHKIAHRHLMNRIIYFKATYLFEGRTGMVNDFVQFLEAWLTYHIANYDKKSMALTQEKQ